MLPPLGAALYVPAHHPHLRAIVRGEKLQEVRELIICTEDAVAEHELPQALAQLQAVLDEAPRRPFCFLRPRSPELLRHLLRHPHARGLFAGAVLPKFRAADLPRWAAALPDADFWLMPTLESVEVFDPQAMRALAQALGRWRARILSLRIGGNDLLALLRLRRPRGVTIYETVLGKVIDDLVTTFLPLGFRLSAPVFEYLDDRETLAREVMADLRHGLCGKTAIHPTQVPLINRHYAVHREDLAAAKAILAPKAAGVFRLDGAMCEPATHTPWARRILAEAEAFGIRED